jgi:ATP-binding cassette subfamily C protein LapB
MLVYDRVVPNSAFSTLGALSIGLAIIIIFDFMLKMLRAYFVDHAGMNIDREVGAAAFRKLLEMRLELRNASTGQLTGIMRELETLRDFFASATLVALVDVPFILITLIVVALIGGWVVTVPALVVPLVVLVGVIAQKPMQRLSSQSLEKGLLKQSVLVETIGSIEGVKTSGARRLFEDRWLKALDGHAEVSLTQRLIAAIGTTFASSAAMISYGGVIIVGVFLLADNRMTLGGLIACSILSGRAIAPLSQISQLISRLTATRVAYRQVRSLMDRPSEGPEGEAIETGRLAGAIELQNVSFRYPESQTKVIDDVSLRITPGEKLALVGPVGSGKSTLLRILLGLYPCQSGIVLFDGLDINQLDPDSLRHSIGSVLQEPSLFSGSIRQNIVLDRPGIGEEEMRRAAEISGTHQFAGRIPKGYDLHLADRGEGLSGGQRQSIAIARALATNPPLLVMDEPTSAMDSQTEMQLIDRLRKYSVGKTVIVVTHRKPLLALVDRIVVLEKGTVRIDGPRDTVLAQLTPTKLQRVEDRKQGPTGE